MRDVYMNVDNGLKLETTQTALNRKMDEYIV